MTSTEEQLYTAHRAFLCFFLVSKLFLQTLPWGSYASPHVSLLRFLPRSSCLLFVGVSCLLVVWFHFFPSLFSEPVSWFLVPCLSLIHI